MLYAIISFDVENSGPLRASARPDHLARLDRLQAEGRLELAGPYPAADTHDAGVTGSLVVAEFDSDAGARTWADADPYVAAGVYEKTIVKPFKKVLPK